MGHPGETCKNRREAMGKSLQDAAHALRISVRYLKGIEEGNYGGWPERVFSSGFIRSYAKYLSVDPTPILAEYERSLETAVSKEEPAPQHARPEWLEREKERGSRRASYGFAAGVVLLVGVVLASLTMRRADIPVPASPPAPAPSASASDNAAARADNAAVQVDNAAVRVDNAAEAAGTAEPSAVAAAPASTVSTVGGGGPLTGPFQLFLEASAHTWVMYSFDDGDPIDVTLFVGDKISIQANRRITLKIGNAGGVVGTLNGQRLPPFGESGQVRNVSFGQ